MESVWALTSVYGQRAWASHTCSILSPCFTRCLGTGGITGALLHPKSVEEINSQITWVLLGMDKEDVVHIYNEILLSHKKEQNWVICRDMDGPRDCHTE